MSAKPRVMLDLDGVVYQWERTARYMLRRYYAERPGYGFIPGALRSPSKHWDWIQDNVDDEAWNWLWTEGVRKGLFREGHIYTGAGEAIHEMSEFANIVVVTKRPAQAINDTLEWLAFRRWQISGFHFLTEDADVKSSVQPEFEVYIDDSLAVMEDLNKNTSGTLIMPDRPWNRDEDDKHGLLGKVWRAFDWNDVIDKTRLALKDRGYEV